MSQLKPQDLRIGNYVNYNSMNLPICGISSPKPLKDKRFADKWLIELFDGASTIDCTIDEIHAIPLTEEILLMAGFNKVKNSKESHLYKESFNWYSSMPEYIEIEHDNGTSVSRQDIECKFLNQLQNLFYSIYNEQLEINLK